MRTVCVCARARVYDAVMSRIVTIYHQFAEGGRGWGVHRINSKVLHG